MIAARSAVIGADAFDQRALDLGVAPAADTGLAIGRDVRRGGDKGRRVEGEAAGQRFVRDDAALGIARRVAVAEGHDGVDEIVAALDRGFDQMHDKLPPEQQAAKEAVAKHDFALWHDRLPSRQSRSSGLGH